MPGVLTSYGTGEGQGRAMINMLPDDVLLDVFDCYRKGHKYSLNFIWKWYSLAHVCQRWRQIIFTSPHRLNLRILCTYGTLVRKNLCIWPTLPIAIDYGDSKGIAPNDEDNVLAALQYPHRVCFISLYVTHSQFRQMASVMEEPFPMLSRLTIIASSTDGLPVLPAKFLGGSAPCLQSIYLRGVPFSSLPPLLVSASNLVSLTVELLSYTGYVTPDVLVAGLATLLRLESFIIKFQSATRRPASALPPATRTVLPSLNYFHFKGTCTYLEDLIARIDSPPLNHIYIDYLNHHVDVRAEQLFQFIDRSVRPGTLRNHARVTFFTDHVSFDIYRHGNNSSWKSFPASILCDRNWRASEIVEVLNQFAATRPDMVHLKLVTRYNHSRDTSDAEWLHLLHQTSAVQTLHLSRENAERVAHILEDITAEEMVAAVLPSLELISLQDQPLSSIEKFAAVRRLGGRPITVINSEAEFDERIKAYFSN